MARIRTLKPEILEDAETAGLSDTAFRLFVGAIVLADDHGNLRAELGWLQGQIWWRHGNPPRVAEFLRELQRANLIVLYEVRGQKYMHLRGWQKHQRIDNAGKPRVPTLKDPEAIPILSDAEFTAEVSRNFSANRREIPLDHDHDHERDLDLPTSRDEAGASEPAPKKSRKKPATFLPVDWVPNEQAVAKAAELRVDVRREAEKFRNHADTNERKCVNWNAAFSNWLLNASERGSQPRLGGIGQPYVNPSRAL